MNTPTSSDETEWYAPGVAPTFTLPDGREVERGSREDLHTLEYRVFLAVEKACEEVGLEAVKELFGEAIYAYNRGWYESALKKFKELVEVRASFFSLIDTHIAFCRDVLSKTLSPEDLAYEAEMKRWRRKPNWRKRLTRWRRKWLWRDKWVWKVRCKHCGHYTRYIDVNQQLGPIEREEPEKRAETMRFWGGKIGGNFCYQCGRAYAIPDFVWDSKEGIQYMRHSGTVSY